MQGVFLSKRGFLVVVAVFSALLLAAGCGSSDSSTTASSETSTGSQESSSGESSEGSPNQSGNSSGGSSGGSSEGNPNGGGNGNTAGNAGKPASTSFTGQVLTVCAKHKQEWEEKAKVFLEKTNESPPKPTETPPEIVVIETVIVPTFQAEVDDLRGLEASSGTASWFAGFVDTLQQVVDETGSNPEGFLESEGSFGEAEKLAKAHKITVCAHV